jgi:hypothetical protein
MTAAYPALSELLGSYFHEQWDHRSGSQPTIERMIQDTPRAKLQRALVELDALLSSGVCEPQLTDVLQFELGCNVTPANENVDASGWLHELRRELSKSLWTERLERFD